MPRKGQTAVAAPAKPRSRTKAVAAEPKRAPAAKKAPAAKAATPKPAVKTPSKPKAMPAVAKVSEPAVAVPAVMEVAVTPIETAPARSLPECRVYDSHKGMVDGTSWNAMRREITERGYEIVAEELEGMTPNMTFENSGVHIRVYSKLDLDAYLNGRPPTHCENL